MIEILLSEMPTTKQEFLEVIPEHFRHSTKAEEGQYLEEVLEIIKKYI